MANYFTHLAFDIPASAEDAERFVQFLEAATAIENDQQPFMGPEIEALFRSSDQNAEQACIDLAVGPLAAVLIDNVEEHDFGAGGGFLGHGLAPVRADRRAPHAHAVDLRGQMLCAPPRFR